jgi:hypothetical protein
VNARLTLAILFLLAWTSHANEKGTSATDTCVRLLSKSAEYSLVLKGREPFVLLTRASPTPNPVSLAKVMARFPQGSAIVRSFPELAKLKWFKTGSWDYHAEPLGPFGRIVRYHVSRDAFFAIEMKLELENLNEELVRALLGPLETKGVYALVNGSKNYIAVYRLDLSDLSTRAALKEFLKFLKRNEMNVSSPL